MEYDLVNRRHPHPLLFDEEGKFNGGLVVCLRCRLPLYTAGFSCSDSDCNFHIHQSCLHHPPQIRSPFHPQHPLVFSTHNQSCGACGQTPSLNQIYWCSECSFSLDMKCAVADTKSSCLSQTTSGKYLHISHPHPLTFTLQQRQQNRGEIKKLVECVICELPIESGSPTYFCSQCDDAHFHRKCAELPLQLQIPDHPHPLSLQNTSRIDGIPCDSCGNPCKWFIYSCSQCKFFNLHIACLQSFNHKHTFTRLRTRTEFTCRVCGEKSKDRFLWFCDICHILVHKECVDFPLQLRIREHKHDLNFNYFLPYMVKIHCKICGREIDIMQRGEYGCSQCDYEPPDIEEIIRCKICGREINIENAAGYGCSECNYFTHFNCAQRSRVDLQSTPPVHAANEELEGEKEIQHFSHPHNLTLFAPEKIIGEYKVCDGCMKCLSVSSPSYGCDQCDFFLHEECAKLPTTKSHPRLHPHLLTLISIPNFVFQCEACLQHFHGFAYHCKTCLSTFDVRCTSIQISFPHPNHQHPLYLNEIEKSETYFNMADCKDCKACGEQIDDKLMFRCSDTDCNFYLDLRCATLPVIVRYRFDPHPLNLTFVEEEKIDEYFCDICEDEREPGLWFYNCRKCSFTAHPRCALGEFPYVKSTMHETHKHPLSLVMKGNEEEGRICGACKKSCAHNLAFECGACNFNVHATGCCYNDQVQRGSLVFTKHNVFSRANQPYEQSIDNLPIIVTLGPFGGDTSNRWTEWVFSTIRKFVVYHNPPSNQLPLHISIQIQYLKKGNLVWSKHGEEEGIKSEVSFDYPDEYLVSIHGSHDWQVLPISSLTLQTNRKTYGPFGVEADVKFSSEKKGVRIIGIFGSNSSSINSIGFYGVSTRE